MDSKYPFTLPNIFLPHPTIQIRLQKTEVPQQSKHFCSVSTDVPSSLARTSLWILCLLLPWIPGE